MSWTAWMFLASAGGSIASVFYPNLVRFMKDGQPVLVSTTSSFGRKVGVVLCGIAIGLVVAALSFATFLGSASNQEALRQLGPAAFFTAIAAGFAAGAVIEEPLKKT